MNLKIIFSAVFLFIVSNAVAQKNAIIKFDTTVHDFGNIYEINGKVNTTFYFTNKGSDTLKIIYVKPSCACTTVDWTKSPLLPGDKGFIKVEYDPANRSGLFSKGITVGSNATEIKTLLVVKGNVISRPRTILDTFPLRTGNVLLTTNHVAFMDTKNTQVKTDTIEIYNYWNKPLTLSFNTVPAYISCKAVPPILQPSKRGLIIVTYDAVKKNDFGFVYDYINLETNDSIEKNKPLTISANIIEDFTKLTAKQKKRAPKIIFDTDTYDFGTAKEDDIVKFSFEFKNTGKDKLIIHKTKASCGCTASSPEKIILKSGESSKIDIEFNTSGKKGDQHKTITVISNDPEKPVITLNIKGKVIPN